MILPSTLLMILSSCISYVTASDKVAYQLVESKFESTVQVPININYKFGEFVSKNHELGAPTQNGNPFVLDKNVGIGYDSANDSSTTVGDKTWAKVHFKRQNETTWYPYRIFYADCDNQPHSVTLVNYKETIVKFLYTCGPNSDKSPSQPANPQAHVDT